MAVAEGSPSSLVNCARRFSNVDSSFLSVLPEGLSFANASASALICLMDPTRMSLHRARVRATLRRLQSAKRDSSLLAGVKGS